MDDFFQTNYAPSKTVKNDSNLFYIDPSRKIETGEKQTEDVNQEIFKVYQWYRLPNIPMFKCNIYKHALSN